MTEDDVNEIKQEISSFRYELLEVLKTSGFNTSMASGEYTSSIHLSNILCMVIVPSRG